MQNESNLRSVSQQNKFITQFIVNMYNSQGQNSFLYAYASLIVFAITMTMIFNCIIIIIIMIICLLKNSTPNHTCELKQQSRKHNQSGKTK